MSSALSPSFQSLLLRHSSFFNPSLALPTSQLILQPFHWFTYVTAHSPTLLSLHLRHRIFTYVTWRAAHATLSFFVTAYSQSKGLFPPADVCETRPTHFRWLFDVSLAMNFYDVDISVSVWNIAWLVTERQNIMEHWAAGEWFSNLSEDRRGNECHCCLCWQQARHANLVA